MSANKLTVFVSHSGKQYVHRLIEGLLADNNQVTFCTPLWWQNMPYWIKVLPSALRKKVLGQVIKKSFTFSSPVKLLLHPSSVIEKEIADVLTRRHNKELNQTNLEIKHDLFAAKALEKQRADIVIGYEISSLATFKEAINQKSITILDLAQIHYKCIDRIAHDYPDMHYILENGHIELIRERKGKEYELADYIFALSTFACQTLIDEGINVDRIFTLNLGFDVDLFKPKQQYSTSGPLKLMICGTDMIRKGLRLILQVMGNLQARGFEIGLTVIGPTREATQVAGEYPHVHFVNLVPFLMHEDLVKQYQLADLFVFPSYLDSWAMTVLEAMACGTPVIVTENTGSKDAVNKGGGLVIPAGDVEALEKSIVYFYENREALISQGKKAVEVAQHYTWANYNRELGKVMEKIRKKHAL